ncbi:MAG TPA: type ISP restriction/modification enzyme [Rhizomicrobium sp.]|nr:type ISP restriction/modification enzyme [Rhizomicrobium sp.]
MEPRRDQKNLADFGQDKKLIRSVLYAPFDERQTYYTNRSRGFLAYPVYDVLKHMLQENIAVTSIRKADVAGDWDFAFVTAGLMVHHALSMKEGNYVFPLWLYSEGIPRQENFSPSFRVFLDDCFDQHYSPEEILGYIYAVLHAPTYRAHYAEFLRSDFPRIPFPKSAEDFESLSRLGWALVEAHLLRQVPSKKLAQYQGKGDHAVEAVRYVLADKALWINKTQFFKPVPDNVWNFHIGGYQVLEKYLKSRKTRALSLDEINHVSAVADSLAFTIKQMDKIDEAYVVAFPGRG